MKIGTNRIVFYCGNYVIKIPNFTYSHTNFLVGCLANWRERDYCKVFKFLPEFYNLVSPSYFCSWFGLIQIQRKVEVLNRELSESELHQFKGRFGDIHKSNFGWFENKLVCLDYGT
jgi:hypothetical protein